MRWTKRTPWLGQLPVFLSVLVLSSLAWGQAAAPVDWQAILKAAVREGKVTVGIPASGELRRVLEKSFTERFKDIQI
jgi:hypothetical protein